MPVTAHMLNGDVHALAASVTLTAIKAKLAEPTTIMQTELYYVTSPLADGTTLYTRPGSISHFIDAP
jgi:hypothetical protein